MGYGNIMRVETSGASDHTAGSYQWGLHGGKNASEKMAGEDLQDMKKYVTIIKNVAKKHDVDPALIAAIISRESRAGQSIKQTNGWGDNFEAFELMQVDVDPKGGNRKARGLWDSEEHLDQATGILVGSINQIQTKFPRWSKEQQLKGGIAAYNMGDLAVVHSYEEVDENTTGKDYSNDVVARAQWYQRNTSFEPQEPNNRDWFFGPVGASVLIGLTLGCPAIR